MNSIKKVNIRCLPTGVPGLDNLLGGGLPEFSFNLIAGTPGSGKNNARKSDHVFPGKPRESSTVLHGTRGAGPEDAPLSTAVQFF